MPYTISVNDSTQVQAHTEGPMASVESDEEVLYRVRSGDSDALLTLFRRYGRLIFSIGCRILGDAGEAEDLVQEVFLRLSAEQRSFDSTKGSARTWMIQMVYRRAFDRRSYLSRRHFYSDTSVLESPNAFIGVRDFEEDLIERLTAQQLRPAFGELSDKQRETLEWFFFEGLKLGDIDLSKGTYILSGVPPACSATVEAPCIPGGSLPANVVVTPHSNHAIHNTDTGNWQGRLGIAYRLWDKTALRAGHSRFFDEWDGLTQIAQNLGGTWPSVWSFNINSENVSTVSAGVEDPLSLGGGAVFYRSPSPLTNASFFYNPSIKTPVVDQWNLGVDQQISPQITLTLGYVGSHDSRLDNGGIHNTAVTPGPGNAATVASRQPFPYITPTFYDDSTGNSNYNAFEARLTRTTYHGLTYLVPYTWSKSIDLGCSGSFGVEGCAIQNPYDARADRSVSGFDLTHIFSASSVYEIPFGREKQFDAHNAPANAIIGGWQLNGILSLDSGTPYYVTYSGDLANTGNNFVKADVVGNPTPSHRTPAEWISPAAFSAPPAYTFGTMGRNKNLDVSLFRSFSIQDRARIEFRAEAFNLTNTAVFAIPNNIVNAPNLGVVTSTANSLENFSLR